MATRYPTRDGDDRLLAMVAMRRAGQTGTSIARHFGISQQNVSVQTNKVMHADLDESGEPWRNVKKAYWG